MKMTLLDIVQAILASTNGDEVNSINDTVESKDIASFVRDSYYELIAGLNLPETFTLYNLDPSLDSGKPTLMYIPQTANSLVWLKYDRRLNDLDPPNFQEVKYLDLETFTKRMYDLGNDTDPTINFLHNNIRFFARNDRAPTYYTSYDDRTLVFDSYDQSMDTTLQSSKTVAWGEQAQVFRMEDDFIPNLDDKQFTLLLNEAKSQTSIEQLKQPNPKAEARARRGWVRSTKRNHNLANLNYALRYTTKYGRIPWPR